MFLKIHRIKRKRETSPVTRYISLKNDNPMNDSTGVCPLCTSMLKDPVSISCGHNYCRGCINEFWNTYAGDYVCPQCGNPSETHVACDFCTERRLKAVKCCLTCDVSLCETHIKQHYTIPALQKHTLSDVKTRPSQQHQNTDNSFRSIRTGQQDQTNKTDDIIKVWYPDEVINHTNVMISES
uniref:RING-type domain-containing protein n=1 Tax=Cyprinus carpio TaxID=7962 RepID=A0A8C1VY44_CYPCA